jgi:hypothetical protein
MIWLVIAIIGSGTFIYSGISVLSDPFCQSVDFGGGRVIQITCRQDSFGAFSQTSAGWLSILGGLAILIFIFRRPILKALSGPNYTQVQRVDDSNFNRAFGEVSVQPSLDTEVMATTVDPQETKKCKFCAETINIEAIKCKHCGSSLAPSSSEKIKAYLNTGQGKIVSITTVCFLLISSAVFINESNKAKEMRLLNTSGQICVTGEGEPSVDFGCTSYPNAEINFCAPAKVLNPYWTTRDYEEVPIEGANFNGRIAGIPGGVIGKSCTNPSLPNLFTYKWKSDFRVGIYEMNALEYETLEGETWVKDDTGSGQFTVEISIKK